MLFYTKKKALDIGVFILCKYSICGKEARNHDHGIKRQYLTPIILVQGFYLACDLVEFPCQKYLVKLYGLVLQPWVQLLLEYVHLRCYVTAYMAKGY